MASGCFCRCHNWCWGNNRALQQEGRLMSAFDWAQRARVWDYHMSDGVDVGSALEAALACQVCLRLHTPALSGRPPALHPRPPRPPVEPWTDQADGTNRE